jgi:hypothetical protein
LKIFIHFKNKITNYFYFYFYFISLLKLFFYEL